MSSDDEDDTFLLILLLSDLLLLAIENQGFLISSSTFEFRSDYFGFAFSSFSSFLGTSEPSLPLEGTLESWTIWSLFDYSWFIRVFSDTETMSFS
jgi:hypothetical protein